MSSYADSEPLLDDARVGRIHERLSREYPAFALAGGQIVSAVIEPPYQGTLPDGTVGTSRWPVGHFIVLSPHPRPIQRANGDKLMTFACVWKAAWDQSEKERRHYVAGDRDPAYDIFRELIVHHLSQRADLASLMN